MDHRGAVIFFANVVLVSVDASYKVQVPSEPLVAVRGSYAVLGCSFPPMAQPGIPPGMLVTWQRVEDSRVVHSFYYGRNQLSRQSTDFKNRTRLYVSELWTGNASLRITDVQAQDAGWYLCTVSDDRGTDKAEIKVEYAASYKVQVPSEPLVAVRGSYAVLGCSFPPMAQPGIPPGMLVTWQRVEDSRVVHSFYYGRNQLSRQSTDFKNRTRLYVSELWTGNASLRITDVQAQDAGWYLCTVSDDRGTDKAEIKVEYAAFYSEPQLSIEVGLHNTSVQFETEGFPKAEIQWLGPQKQELEHQSEFKYGDGLCYLKTSYVVQDNGPNVSLMLRLSNQVLDQVLVRRIHLSQGHAPADTRRASTIALSSLCFFLFLVCTALLIYICRNCNNFNNYNGTL